MKTLKSPKNNSVKLLATNTNSKSSSALKAPIKNNDNFKKIKE